MQKKRLAPRWSFALRIVAALMIVCSLPNPSFAAKNWYSWGPSYTGPIGRVLEYQRLAGYIYGTYQSYYVSASTDPYRTMDPVNIAVPLPGMPGTTYNMYSRHEHFYTPNPSASIITHAGQTSSTVLPAYSTLFWWNSRTLEP